MIRLALGAVTCAVLLLAMSCARIPGTPVAATSSTTSVLPVSATDARLCTGQGGLEERGRGFYATYEQLMANKGALMSISPIKLSAQLAVLTTVGASESSINGAPRINEASAPLRLALTQMVRDADRLAQRYADQSISGVSGSSDITPIVNSFTNALIACTEAGQAPVWFNPASLLRK